MAIKYLASKYGMIFKYEGDNWYRYDPNIGWAMLRYNPRVLIGTFEVTEDVAFCMLIKT